MRFKDRKRMRLARQLARAARKLLRIHRDVLAPHAQADVAAAATEVDTALAARDVAAICLSADKLEKQLNRYFPRPPHAALRENIEVLLVAVIVAMAVRTFFLQPFKIPTGSMQPTLYGIHEDPDCDGNAPFHKRIAELALFGKSHRDGRCIRRGDHIFVDKLSYHFRKPRRGEVIVFETGDIPDIPPASRGKFYIKRLIGVGGDIVQIKPPHVLINGKILDERPAFQRIYSRKEGYNGYAIPESFPPPKYIRSPADAYKIPEGHLFVLGDNSLSSLDGRFWGALPDKDLVGRAVFVYWPFSRRIGLID